MLHQANRGRVWASTCEKQGSLQSTYPHRELQALELLLSPRTRRSPEPAVQPPARSPLSSSSKSSCCRGEIVSSVQPDPPADTLPALHGFCSSEDRTWSVHGSDTS